MNDLGGRPAMATPESLDQWERDFARDGFVMLPGLLSPQEAAILRDGVVQAHQSPCPTGIQTPLHRTQMFRRGPQFAAMLDRPPIIDLAERILGDICHVIANNTVFTGPGMGVDTWHVDEAVLVPVPPGARCLKTWTCPASWLPPCTTSTTSQWRRAQPRLSQAAIVAAACRPDPRMSWCGTGAAM